MLNDNDLNANFDGYNIGFNQAVGARVGTAPALRSQYSASVSDLGEMGQNQGYMP